MKVQKITKQPEFQPVTLQITIESQEELDAVKKLTGMNSSVAGFLVDRGVIETSAERHICSVFLGKICQELNE